MSDTDGHQQLLQILEAHGQRFLNSFEQPPKPSSSKRKLEASDEPLTNEEDDEEWHGFGTRSVDSDDSQDGGSIDSFCGALHYFVPDHKLLMNEEDSEEQFSDEDTSPVGGPSVVTFQDPRKKYEASASDRTLKKAFMVRSFCEVLFAPDNNPHPSRQKFPNYDKKSQDRQRRQNPTRTKIWTCTSAPHQSPPFFGR